MPLPPAKPKGVQAALRTAPLPPRRPPELAEEDSAPEVQEREALQQEAPAEAGSADGFSREPPRPALQPQMASRGTVPEAAPSAGVAPLPPERPQSPGRARPAPAAVPDPGGPPQGQALPVSPSTPLVMPQACADLVADGEIEASLDTTVTPNPACGSFVPVRLTAVRLGDGRMIPLKPAAISRCEMTIAAARWVREALAPAIGGAGGVLGAVRIADSYNCRPRNRVSGAKMSEHGRGNAVDVGGFELGDGRVWIVAKGGLPNPFRTAMKDSACTRFTTVLGPGSDGYHEDHIHVDLAQRRNDFRLCHWNLDAGTAVASRKDKPAGDAAPSTPPGASIEARAGQEKGRQEKDAEEETEVTQDAEPVSPPPARSGPVGGKSAPAGKGVAPRAKAGSKDATSKGATSKATTSKDGISPKQAQPN